MPLFKKTFKKKRSALGVKRDKKTRKMIGLPKNSRAKVDKIISGEINKLEDIVSKYGSLLFSSRDVCFGARVSKTDFKRGITPDGYNEVKNKFEGLIKKKLRLQYKKPKILNSIDRSRNHSRLLRQSKIISKKLNLASKENGLKLNFNNFDASVLKDVYVSYLKKHESLKNIKKENLLQMHEDISFKQKSLLSELKFKEKMIKQIKSELSLFDKKLLFKFDKMYKSKIIERDAYREIFSNFDHHDIYQYNYRSSLLDKIRDCDRVISKAYNKRLELLSMLGSNAKFVDK